MASRISHVVYFVVALSLFVVLAGCSGTETGPRGPEASTPGTASPTPAPKTIVVTPIPVPPGVHLSFVQQRIDEGTPRAQVRVINGTERTLRVRSVGVDWAGYPLRLMAAPYKIFPGQTVDLRYLLPSAVCTPAAAAAVPYGLAVTQDGRRIRRKMGDDGVRFLTRLRESACNARRLDATATLSYGDTWRPARRNGRPVLLGTLILTRPARPGPMDPMRVTQIEGSVLFDLSLTGDRSASRLRPEQREVAVPIEVRDGGRCDPHSRGQSTQTFLFRAFLSVDGGAELSRLVPPSKAQQRLLLRFLDRACSS